MSARRPLRMRRSESPRSDSALRESEEKFRAAFEHAPLGMCLLGLDGRFLSANPAFCRMLDHTEPELQALSVREVTHPDDLDKTSASIERLLGGQGGDLMLEKRYLKRGGDAVWAAVHSHLLRSADGAPRFFITHAQDITERKRADESLRESEEKFRIAFENAPTGMSIIRPDGRYLAVNPVLCQMFGHSAEDLLSGTIELVTHPDDVERSKVWIRRMIAGDMSEPECEKRYIHQDGHVVWGVVRARWVRNADGSPRLSVAHILDITERSARRRS
jgi:PAS domain S-box-containing protein